MSLPHLGARLQELAEQDEGDEHGARLEEVAGVGLSGPRRGVRVGPAAVQDGDHGVEVGRVGAQRHQHVHVCPAAAACMNSLHATLAAHARFASPTKEVNLVHQAAGAPVAGNEA